MTWKEIQAVLRRLMADYVADVKSNSEPKAKGLDDLQEDGDVALDFTAYLKEQFGFSGRSAKRGRKAKKSKK